MYLFPNVSAMPKVMKGKIKQLTQSECALIDKVIRPKKGTPTDALRRINKARCSKKIRELEDGAVHRYAKGLTHKRNARETRGRKRLLSRQDVRKLDQARRRLIQQADNERRVTYDDIIQEAGLEDPPCERVCADALRKLGIGFRPPRRKICVSEEDARKRRAIADIWSKRPAKYWTHDVHAYLDAKTFPRPSTLAQRKTLLSNRITGHLRKPSKGIDRGFTKPREKHTFVGMPSVIVCAAVAYDKIIMWHIVEGSWGGAAAATMYEDHLKPALLRKWGERAQYRVVEDGDRKGHASRKGIDAKRRAKITALTLPPRTPSLMPLDYAIWQRIEEKLIDTAPAGTEDKGVFLVRLRKIATSLPKKYIKMIIGRMHENIKALSKAKGYTPNND